MHGFLNVNKPAGLTSHDVVYRVRKWTGVRHVGHGGTLDPAATGVLPLGLGHGTRLLEFLPDVKVYQAAIEFGRATNTYDASGVVTQEQDPGFLDRGLVAEALDRYVGNVAQQPPPFSAVRQDGARLYELARRGIAVEAPPRTVRIDSIRLVHWEPPLAWTVVECGRGTYMRSLAHDVGRDLGCGAHLRELVRLQDGEFRIESSVGLDDLRTALDEERAGPLLYPLETPIRGWPALRLTGSEERDVLQGRTVCANDRRLSGVLGAGFPQRVRAHALGGELLALLQRGQGDPCWHPFKVFPASGT